MDDEPEDETMTAIQTTVKPDTAKVKVADIKAGDRIWSPPTRRVRVVESVVVGKYKGGSGRMLYLKGIPVPSLFLDRREAEIDLVIDPISGGDR